MRAEGRSPLLRTSRRSLHASPLHRVSASLHQGRARLEQSPGGIRSGPPLGTNPQAAGGKPVQVENVRSRLATTGDRPRSRIGWFGVTRTSGILLILLLASNTAWYLARQVRTTVCPDYRPDHPLTHAEPPGTDLEAEVRWLKDRLHALEGSLTGPALAIRAETNRQAPASAPAGVREADAAADAREREVRAARLTSEWRAQILQVRDAGLRKHGLVALEDAIWNGTPELKAAALRSLHAIRALPFDKTSLRHAVRGHLSDPDPRTAAAARGAVLAVEPEPQDRERLLELARAAPHDRSLLTPLTWLFGRRVEGPLADLYVQALATSEPAAAREIADSLRGAWVSAEVEAAVLAAWRRVGPTERERGWFHILGQVEPTRSERVQVLFEALQGRGNGASPDLLRHAFLPRVLDPGAAESAARLALECLSNASDPHVAETCVQILAWHGTAEQAIALGRYAANELVAPALRARAETVARALAGRR